MSLFGWRTGRKPLDARPPSAPAWMVTYGDTMGLLLCLFIVLFSMVDLRNNERSERILSSVRTSFGGSENVATPRSAFGAPGSSLLEKLQERAEGFARPDLDNGAGTGLVRFAPFDGGIRLFLGAEACFDSSTGQLQGEAREMLSRMAERLLGSRTRILIRGHLAQPASGPTAGWETRDASYMQARAIAEELSRNGVPPQRIRIEAVGDTESPTTADNGSQTPPKDRVEIVITLRDENR